MNARRHSRARVVAMACALGPNWVCATTAPHAGGSGEIADGLFTVYPA